MSMPLNLVVGIPDPGHWCKKCARPSTTKYPVYQMDLAGMTHFADLRHCDTCADAPNYETIHEDLLAGYRRLWERHTDDDTE